MTTTNYSETSDNIKTLNAEIRQTLIEVFPLISPELQLEVTSLVHQAHHINYLINKKKDCWLIGKNKSNNESTKYSLFLEEIKNILLISKSDKVSTESIREFRLNLEKEVNSDRYFFWGHILNFLTYIYYVKSIPFKIFLGLATTTVMAIIALSFSAKEIYRLDMILDKQKIEQNKNISVQTPTLPSNSSILPINPEKKSVISDNTIHPNRRIWYALVYSATAGVLGSVASILLRIIDFQGQKYDDPLIPFFIGLFKPIIGLILGIFAFSLISSDTIIKIDFLFSSNEKTSSLITNQARQDLFIFSCAFLIGFSERFASDLLKKSESVLVEK
ncbi:MAG: hypothetical protein ACRC6M_13525 [Microcystaceae cyanobacterium]